MRITEENDLSHPVYVEAVDDVTLKYNFPQAEYMCGCAATALGMLLGYYDLYGIDINGQHYDLSNLIDGDIQVNSREGNIYDMTSDLLLNKTIATEAYKTRFYKQSKDTELSYTYVNSDPDQGLNVSVWDCLADYLGTGQYWRGNGDLSTAYYPDTSLKMVEESQSTITIDGVTVPVKFHDFKYGLSLYIEDRGYALDKDETCSYSINNFTFDDYVEQIDAGRPVLLTMVASGGHMVVGYGYNKNTNEIIFDDTYHSDCRMSWDGTYEYSGENYSLSGASTVVFNLTGDDPEPEGEYDLITNSAIWSSMPNATVSQQEFSYDSNIYVTAVIKNNGTEEINVPFTVVVKVDGLEVASETVSSLGAGASYACRNLSIGKLQEGKHNWSVTADSRNVVEEVNEQNNTLTGSFTVKSYQHEYVPTQNLVNLYKDNTLLEGAKYLLGTILDGISCTQLDVLSGGTARNTYVTGDALLYIKSGGAHGGSLDISETGRVVVDDGGIIELSLINQEKESSPIIRNISQISGSPLYQIKIDDATDSERKNELVGRYTLATNASRDLGKFQIVDKNGKEVGSYMVVGTNVTSSKSYLNYRIDCEDGLLYLEIRDVAQQSTSITSRNYVDTISWNSVQTDNYLVTYSDTSNSTALTLQTSSNTLDVLTSSETLHQWSVSTTDKANVSNGATALDANGGVVNTPQVIQSNSNNISDLFLAHSSDKWGKSFYAYHLGSLGHWDGTGEKVALEGKNVLADFFIGSTDANILYLTDDANGDALFIDDIYTALPESLKTNQSRLVQIEQIYAGDGDDLIDLTSMTIDFASRSLSIHGGNGNDVIWCNGGTNTIFGDAGNDRLVGSYGDDILIGGVGDDNMHGGGGDDIFCFGENWGNDCISQLADGKVTLWFESSAGTWDSENMTYYSGNNSVTICGVSADNVTVKFGDDGSDRYRMLSIQGAFASESQNIRV